MHWLEKVNVRLQCPPRKMAKLPGVLAIYMDNEDKAADSRFITAEGVLMQGSRNPELTFYRTPSFLARPGEQQHNQ